jgi:hypothetical protein
MAESVDLADALYVPNILALDEGLDWKDREAELG